MLTTNNTGMNKSNSFVLYYNTRGLILYHNGRVSVSIKKKKLRNVILIAQYLTWRRMRSVAQLPRSILQDFLAA